MEDQQENTPDTIVPTQVDQLEEPIHDVELREALDDLGTPSLTQLTFDEAADESATGDNTTYQYFDPKMISILRKYGLENIRSWREMEGKIVSSKDLTELVYAVGFFKFHRHLLFMVIV